MHLYTIRYFVESFFDIFMIAFLDFTQKEQTTKKIIRRITIVYYGNSRRNPFHLSEIFLINKFIRIKEIIIQIIICFCLKEIVNTCKMC